MALMLSKSPGDFQARKRVSLQSNSCSDSSTSNYPISSSDVCALSTIQLSRAYTANDSVPLPKTNEYGDRPYPEDYPLHKLCSLFTTIVFS